MQGRIGSHQTRQPRMICRNIRLTLAFDGTAYHGWQIQTDEATIQGVVSRAIRQISGETVKLTGSGRTDAGTHARRLMANFTTQSRMAAGSWTRALNSALPRDIRVLSARRVSLRFHARRDARSKTYRYQIYLGPILPPHLAREYYHYPYAADLRLMQKAARRYVGEHDFSSFTPVKISESKSTVREIFRCQLKKRGCRLWFTVEGNGFLQYMVRNMVGTLIEVGRKKMSLEQFGELFHRRDRRCAGFTAPAHGLVLVKVRY